MSGITREVTKLTIQAILTFVSAFVAFWLAQSALPPQRVLTSLNRNLNLKDEWAKVQFKLPFDGIVTVRFVFAGLASDNDGANYSNLSLRVGESKEEFCPNADEFGQEVDGMRRIDISCGPFEVKRGDEFVFSGRFKHARTLGDLQLSYIRLDSECWGPLKWICLK